MSQRLRILDGLRRARPGWVCGVVWLAAYMPRYAAVVHVLRKAGYQINSEPCDEHNHTGAISKYQLIREPDGAMPQEQMRWI
jgi:hypothetical protein